MSEPARVLHLVDEHGEATPQCVGCIERDRDLAALRRRRTILENELKKLQKKQQADDAVRPEVEEMFGFWQIHCNHPRARLDTDRFSRLAWGLAEYEQPGCARSIIGYGAFPYVGEQGRQTTGTTKQRFDDLELIFRNAKQVEQGWKLADRAEEEALVA